jgi:DNA-binding CsgD family transcriptional regulator
MNTSATASPVSTLSRREEEVLALMADGRTNVGIARELVLSCGAVEKHVANIFAKLDLPASPLDHRRVLAVLAYVHARSGRDPRGSTPSGRVPSHDALSGRVTARDVLATRPAGDVLATRDADPRRAARATVRDIRGRRLAG